MNKFIPGLELARQFYAQAVRPIVDDAFPALQYTAGLIDYGSDVLGFDTAVSTDHQWGPRLSLFLAPDDLAAVGGALDDQLRRRLPPQFCTFPTSFSRPGVDGTRVMEPGVAGQVDHLIRIHSPQEFFMQHLGLDVHAQIGLTDWLFFPQQRLATIRKGRLFHDGLNLAAVRQRLDYYPDQVWYELMAAEWERIAQEEAFVGRCGDVGDDLGSRIVAARQAHRLMNLCFLQQREYIPYSKWLGTAFQRLHAPAALAAALEQALGARDWPVREDGLCQAAVLLGERHNDLGLTPCIGTQVRNFHGRRYRVVGAGNFAASLRALVTAPELTRLHRLGGIDQITDHVAILSNMDWAKQARTIYGMDSDPPHAAAADPSG